MYVCMYVCPYAWCYTACLLLYLSGNISLFVSNHFTISLSSSLSLCVCVCGLIKLIKLIDKILS